MGKRIGTEPWRCYCRLNKDEYMKTIESETYVARIYICGSLEQIKQCCRACAAVNPPGDPRNCVTIERADFIYKGGEESGVVIGLLNYPRFPATPRVIWEKAVELARHLLEATYQDSVLVAGLDKTLWITKRE